VQHKLLEKQLTLAVTAVHLTWTRRRFNEFT
jgi:hypothetical protein